MTTQEFDRLLQANNAIRISKDLIIFKDYELYSFEKDKGIKYKTIDGLCEKNPEVAKIIEETEKFYYEYGGGRGSSSNSSELGGGFDHADLRGRGSSGGEMLQNAELNLDTAKGNSYEDVLKRFQAKYSNADHEYGIEIDEDGFVHQHIEGGKHAVAISAGKNNTIIHNHPSGSNFSDLDLINTASGNAKGIVATSSSKNTRNSTYKFIKNNNFKAKEFIKAIKKAQWPKNLGYNKGADWWLKKNQKTYGYKYSHKGKFEDF